MFDFFKGWRRKTGCVVLLAAASIFVLNVRSYWFVDQLHFASGEFATQEVFRSDCGAALWISVRQPGAKEYWPWQFSHLDTELNSRFPERYASVAWRYRWLGFCRGSYPLDVIAGGNASFIGFPYWVAVLPLTLLSAGLLLWKPRPKPEPKPDA
jgi:hypothetical protein